MAKFSIVHDTRYTYERPVRFGPQRLMLRPRDSHAIRLVEADLSLSPPGQTRWAYDAFGNCVCYFIPRGEAKRLIITSHLTIEPFPATLFKPEADDPHSAIPVIYGGEDREALSPFLSPATDDPTPEFVRWLRGLLSRPDEPALDLLLRFNQTIHNTFDYQTRYAEGVQSPHDTLRLGSGSCRDFAWLMVEGLRRLGFAARFVSGYLYDPADSALRGAGATHAWCEVFMPDLGWTQFDPTNGLAESPHLIAVAVSRAPAQAAPVSGYIVGNPGYTELFVDVRVTPAILEAEPA
jgi:YD repeat-containing protein